MGINLNVTDQFISVVLAELQYEIVSGLTEAMSLKNMVVFREYIGELNVI